MSHSKGKEPIFNPFHYTYLQTLNKGLVSHSSSFRTASFLAFQVSLSKSLYLLLPQFPICEVHGDSNSCLLHLSCRTQSAALKLSIKASPAELKAR